MDKKIPFYRKKIFITFACVLILFIAILVVFRASPIPGASIIRLVFDMDASQKRANMEKVVGNIADVTSLTDRQYIEGDKDAFLDVYVPHLGERDGVEYPIVIWIHGGAWLSGDKTDAAPYFKLLASKGFVVVALNYTHAPYRSYPTQVNQLNHAYAYVSKHAKEFRGDASKLVLAGDSAGAQLTSQLATIATNPGYAKEMNIVPSLNATQISALILYCGIYKMEGLAEPHESLSKIVSWGNRITVWSYLGTRDTNSPLIRQMSAYYHVDKNFPDTFISGGNGDPLTNAQSKPFAQKLMSLGVPVQTKFYDDDHTPSLPHENQFVLDKDGQDGFKTMVEFIKTKT